jgi:hypothetical protein
MGNSWISSSKSSNIRMTFNGQEIQGVRDVSISYSNHGGGGGGGGYSIGGVGGGAGSVGYITYSIDISGDSLVTEHRSGCTVDLNGVIDNDVTGPYVYCSCGILVRVKSSAEPLKKMVERVVAAGLHGIPRDLAKVTSMRERVNEQISILQGLLGVLDAYANKEMSQLTEWARESTVDTDPSTETNIVERREIGPLEQEG